MDLEEVFGDLLRGENVISVLPIGEVVIREVGSGYHILALNINLQETDHTPTL